jgi:predicted lipoprotein with Yx(FWY)xxD motif
MAAAASVAIGGLSASAVMAGTASAAAGHTVVISAMKNAKLGTILVSGNTVYMLKSTKTACTGACAKAWPEVLLPKGVMKAKAGPGVNASKLGVVTRAHGAHQVTYNGEALYWFVGDKAPGQVNGNGLHFGGGTWSVVATANVARSSSTPTTAASSGAAY